MNDFAIGPARLDERAACLAMLPELRGQPAELLVAREGGEIVGAVAVVWESWTRPAGFPFAVHVLPGARRRGVARALVGAALDLIDGETDGLWSLGNVVEDSDGAAFLRGCGFEGRKRILHFHMETTVFHAHMTRIVERLRRNNRIPDAARAIALRDARLDEVAQLVARELGSSPHRLHDRFKAAMAGTDPNGIDLDHSTVVMEGEHIAGALLCRWNAAYAIIEANVVAPAWRNTYVNALQLQTSTERGFLDGSVNFRFDCDETIRDSMNLALRGTGEPLTSEARFYRACEDT